MGRNLLLPALVMVGLAASATPSAAFWARSQWLACSEAATAADYQRWRCWELDGYAGAIAPGDGAGGAYRPLPSTRSLQPRRGAVSRLG